MNVRLLSILLAVGAACGTARAVSPPWAFTRYPARLHYTAPGGSALTALLHVEHADLGFDPETFRILGPPPGYQPLAWRQVDRAPGRTRLLAQLPPGAPHPAPLLLYAAAAGAPREDEQPGLASDAPIAATLTPLRGRGIPDTLPRLIYMTQNERQTGRPILLQGLPANLPPQKRPALVTLTAIVACPEPGRYTFRASEAAPLFLFLNDQPAPGATGRIQGPDSVEVRIVTATHQGECPVRLDWQPPGADTFQPIPATAFVGVERLYPRKREQLDSTLQPFFEADLKPPYAFRGLPGRFYPLRLIDRSENRLPYAMTRTWSWPGQTTSTQPEPELTFTSPGPHPVTLSLEDELGFTAARTHTVAWDPLLIPHAYQLAAGPFPMPAAWFRHDPIEPALVTQGNWPASIELLLTATLRRTNGVETSRSLPIPATHFPQMTRLGACLAGEFESLAWTLSHQGVVLTNGRFVARHTPLQATPPRLAVDRLESEDGATLVYVTPRQRLDLTPPLLPTNAPLMLIDDCLSWPAAPSAGGTPEGFAALLREFLDAPVQIQPLADWRAAQDAWKPLLKMAETPARAGPTPARLFLAIGGQDAAAGIAPDAFERQAAALTDLLLGVGHAVAWVTPPPFPEWADRARLYAVAIRRVAESRRLPVADLYSAFAGSDAEAATLFDAQARGFLSPHGRRLAAERLAAAMANGRPAPEGAPAP